jgi:hypothetical protein
MGTVLWGADDYGAEVAKAAFGRVFGPGCRLLDDEKWGRRRSERYFREYC